MNRAHSAVLDQTDMAITPSGAMSRWRCRRPPIRTRPSRSSGAERSPRRDQVGATLDLDAEPLGLGEHAGDLALVQGRVWGHSRSQGQPVRFAQVVDPAGQGARGRGRW